MQNKRGILIVVNKEDKYASLSDVLIESILKFTNLDIEYVTINFNRTFDNVRIHTRRINLNLENNENIYYTKLQAAKTSILDEGFLVDADSVVTPEVVKVFDNIDRIDGDILCPLHPQDPHNQLALMKILGIPEKTQPYVHAACFLYSTKSKSFFDKFFKMYERVKKLNLNDRIYYANYDETFINLIYWEEKRKTSFMDCCDPWFGHALATENYLEKYPKLIDNIPFNVKEYIWHGCKEVDKARELIKIVSKKYEN